VADIVSCWTNPGVVNNGIDTTLLMLWPPALGLIVQERKSFRTSSSSASCVSTLCLTDITACDRISKAFLLHICILQVNKYWRWEWSGKPPSASLVCLHNAVSQQEGPSHMPGENALYQTCGTHPLVCHMVHCIQWNLRIKNTLGAELLSSFRRLSFGGRIEPLCNL